MRSRGEDEKQKGVTMPLEEHFDIISDDEIRMKWEQIISRDTDILGGTPVFAGTRVPVQTLIDYLKEGDSLDDFLEGFPSVSRKQAQTFFEIAVNAVMAEERDACIA